MNSSSTTLRSRSQTPHRIRPTYVRPPRPPRCRRYHRRAAFNAAVLGLSSNVAATAAARAAAVNAAVLGLSSSLDSLYTGDVTLAFTSAFFPRRFLGVLSSLHLLCYSV